MIDASTSLLSSSPASLDSFSNIVNLDRSSSVPSSEKSSIKQSSALCDKNNGSANGTQTQGAPIKQPIVSTNKPKSAHSGSLSESPHSKVSKYLKGTHAGRASVASMRSIHTIHENEEVHSASTEPSPIAQSHDTINTDQRSSIISNAPSTYYDPDDLDRIINSSNDNAIDSVVPTAKISGGTVPSIPEPASSLLISTAPTSPVGIESQDSLWPTKYTNDPAALPRRSSSTVTRPTRRTGSVFAKSPAPNPLPELNGLSPAPAKSKRLLPVRRNTIQADTPIGGPVDDIPLEEDVAKWADMLMKRRLSKRLKGRLDDDEDDKVTVGTRIGEGHVNYVLMYNMLTGIRVAVGHQSDDLLSSHSFLGLEVYSQT